LVTGDLSTLGQQALLNSGQWPEAQVFQIPRHGHAHALYATFLAAVQPQVVLLQSDAANLRGDPDPDTLTLFGDIPLFRTDHQGTIHLWTDGQLLWADAES
jgi:beta-lactamase superfamily II metal-dependent hydrolase